MSEKHYDHGKKSGAWKEFHADGKLEKIIVYHQDKKTKESFYYVDDKGKISAIFQYDENEHLVERTSYNRYNGHEYKTITPLQRINGKNVEHGVVKRYCDDKLESETNYENGKVVN